MRREGMPNLSPESRVVILAALVLLTIGIVLVYSASAAIAVRRNGDEMYFLKRQAVWAALGIGGMLAAVRVPPRTWYRISPWLFAGSAVLLVAVLIPGIGSSVNGARRWLRFGPVGFQVSELARLGAILWLARLLSDAREIRFWKGFVPLFGLSMFVVGLIAIEPDLGGAFFLTLVLLPLLLAGGVRWCHLVPACAAGAGLVGGLALFRFEHAGRRLSAFFYPDQDPLGAGYQLQQSLIALGSGGWVGEGLGRGTQKLFFLPEPHSDFILAILGEELGFAGTLSVLTLFSLIAIAGARIASRVPDRFSALVALTLSWMIVLQACINIGVVTGCLPTKGIPLPLISYGGSSLVVSCVAIGILAGLGASVAPGSTQRTDAGETATQHESGP